MGKQAINLVLAGSKYSFTIDSESEEVYRLAEKEVNGYVSEFSKRNVQSFTEKDYLAMTALKLAIVNINNRLSGELSREDTAQLKELTNSIEAYLNNLKTDEK